MGFTEEDEKPRPQFAANAPYLDKNPITGIRNRNIELLELVSTGLL